METTLVSIVHWKKWHFYAKASASLWQYDGQLFLITPYCGSKPLPCFLAKAAGFQTYTTIGSGDTNEGGEDDKGDGGNGFKIPTRRRRVTAKKTSSKKKSKAAAPAGGAAAFIILIVIIVFIYYKRRSITAAIATLSLKQQSDNNENTNVPAAPKVNPAFVLGTSGMSQPPPYMPNNAEGLTMQLQHTALPAGVVLPPPNSTQSPYPQSLVSQPPPMQPPVAYYPTVPYPIQQQQQQQQQQQPFMAANNIHHAQSYPAVSTQSSGYVSAPSQASLQTQTNSRNRSKGNKILSSVVSGITSGFIDSLANDEE
ncbi:cAMP-regulated phosphoprotein 21-like [Hydractinia symbiolongicarpus]|uniref:cAMP-regulated phosphoprotein 21-like n=1 Tax=Hydractinia symbiolongicarpus TaxID=13093 RepID=UPI00254AB4AD|nr:cAMP-regulated phosphoprotein 21-like [Hydractinia symbiolongicarpus]